MDAYVLSHQLMDAWRAEFMGKMNSGACEPGKVVPVPVRVKTANGYADIKSMSVDPTEGIVLELE